MVEFLTTEGVSDRLTNIIREAEKFIWLLSPFINPSDRLKERIYDAQKAERSQKTFATGVDNLTPQQ